MKTNRLKLSFLLLPLVIMGLSSCQEVIDIELNDSDRKYVIEGNLYENDDFIHVRVTRTTSYFDTAPPEPVTDAFVEVTMPDGTPIQLTHIGDGFYDANGVLITDSSTYKLRVEVGSEVFTASTFMPEHVQLDTLEYEYQPPFAGGDDGYNVFLVFDDEVGTNFYQIRSSVNGIPLNEPGDILVVDDRLNDGTTIRIPVFTHLYEANDLVQVELHSIDEATFEFYNTLSQVAGESAGDPFSAAPANPNSNIQGGALGVFAAYTRSGRIIHLPQ